MSKIIDKEIPVAVAPGNRPLAFTFRGRHRVKEIMDSWVEAGEWWHGDSGKSVYRVSTDRGGVFEIYFIHREGRWMLYKTYD